jgi:acyl carrier protein
MTTDSIIASILNKILSPKGLSISGYDENIFETGLIDSFGIVELIVSLEEHFQIKVPYEDMTIQNFSSVSEISKFTERLKDMSSADNG